MAARTMFLSVIGVVIVFALVIKVALLNARLEGYQTAQQLLVSRGPGYGEASGCLPIVVGVGVFLMMGLCFLLALTGSNGTW